MAQYGVSPTVFLAATPLSQQERLLFSFVRPTVIFLVSLAILLLLRRVFEKYWARHMLGPHSALAVLIDATRVPSTLWCLAAAIAIALRNSSLTERQDARAEELIAVFLILSVTLAAANILTRLITSYGERRSLPFAVAGLSRTLVYVVVFLLGTATLLAYLGVNITPLLTALGVGGLAVALALQDTLANFFAGVHILIENPISVGEFIKLSSGEEGTVSDIGWRTTRVRTGNNNIIVIPNTKITTGILTNYSLPDRRVIGEIVIFTGLEADADQVRQIALETAARTPGVLPEPAPAFVFDPGVTAANMQGKLVFWSENRLVQGGVQSELRLQLLASLRKAEVPMPTTERIVVERT